MPFWVFTGDINPIFGVPYHIYPKYLETGNVYHILSHWFSLYLNEKMLVLIAVLLVNTTCFPGPIVQSISLTSSLVVKMLPVLVSCWLW